MAPTPNADDTFDIERSCFGPLKTCWSHTTHQFMAGKVVTRFSFSPLFSTAWMTAMTSSNIIAGFKATGIYPFNRDVFKKDSPGTHCFRVHYMLIASSNVLNASSLTVCIM